MEEKMKPMMKYVMAGALLACPALGWAGSGVSLVTVNKLQISANESLIFLQTQNNQPMTDCFYNSVRLTNMSGDFQKQAYATLLTAKINGLVVTLVGYEVTGPGICEVSMVVL